jgi:hypothetical protein
LIKFPNVILRGSMDFYILLVSHETYYQWTHLMMQVCKLFSLTKGVRWSEEIWYSLRVFVWELCSSLIHALLSVIVIWFMQ